MAAPIFGAILKAFLGSMAANAGRALGENLFGGDVRARLQSQSRQPASFDPTALNEIFSAFLSRRRASEAGVTPTVVDEPRTRPRLVDILVMPELRSVTERRPGSIWP